MKERLLNWWRTRVQRDISTVIIFLGGLDLLSFIGGVESYMTTLIGAKVYAGVRIALGFCVYYRARQAANADK